MESKVIEIARKEVGVKESPAGSNKNKYGEWFGLNGVAWCGQFVSWCYYMAGKSLGNIGYTKGFAGCQTAVAKVEKWGKIVTVPESGDVVFFDFDGNGSFDHTGIFVKDNNKTGTFQCIEGNTSFGNDRNGGSVMLRERKYKTAIFIRPKVK